MEITIAQINPHLGSFQYNTDKIISACAEASRDGADLVVFPELSLLGYAPNDLLERPNLFRVQKKYLKMISQSIPSKISVLLGCVNEESGRLFNSAALIQKNEVKRFFNKTLLPSYDVFDEPRHFAKGSLKKNNFKLKGKNILVAICEDLWFSESNVQFEDPLKNLKVKPDHIISLNASPFEVGKQKKREALISSLSKRMSCPITYVNMCGAQDELIFDGSSFSTNKDGLVTTRLPAFEEKNQKLISKKKPVPSKFSSIEKALILGIKDYFKKTGFKKAHLGLSGGIDSALVIYLASKALGPKNVTGIALPGPYSSALSLKLAIKLSKNLGTHFIEHDINSTYHEFIRGFDKSFGNTAFSLVHENAQARLRGLTLMAYSNKEKSLLLATSNKSELCIGYSTLYGDQCGALMPIGDLLKTDVFKFCKWINKQHESDYKDGVIPSKIISRPPSAELKPNQKDSDSLPDYSELDRSIQKVITLKKAATNELDLWVLNKSYVSEFKRWQACPILKVSQHAFGIGRRMPLAHGFKD